MTTERRKVMGKERRKRMPSMFGKEVKFQNSKKWVGDCGGEKESEVLTVNKGEGWEQGWMLGRRELSYSFERNELKEGCWGREAKEE